MNNFMRESATAFAPATVGNAGVGFDILGFAIEAVGDRITVTRTPRRGEVTIGHISGSEVPMDAAKNTATVGLQQLCRDLGLGFGFQVDIRKGIPIGSGMGGSAASAVGAIVAANALLLEPLPKESLLKYAIAGEFVASGSRHADNAAPCLFGGLTLAMPGESPEMKSDSTSRSNAQVVHIPVPEEILCVLVHPEMRLDTRVARAVLKPEVPLKDHVRQSAHLAGFLAGCFRNDVELIRQGLSDLLIEPQRAHLIPGFAGVKAAALSHGALGCTISGAGPSVFAWVSSRTIAEEVRAAMVEAFLSAGLPSVEAWISPISQKGAGLV